MSFEGHRNYDTIRYHTRIFIVPSEARNISTKFDKLYKTAPTTLKNVFSLLT